MAKKRHKGLRPKRDQFARKKANDSRGWEQKMMDDLKNGETDEEKATKKRRGSKENASRLTNDSL